MTHAGQLGLCPQQCPQQIAVGPCFLEMSFTSSVDWKVLSLSLFFFLANSNGAFI